MLSAIFWILNQWFIQTKIACIFRHGIIVKIEISKFSWLKKRKRTIHWINQRWQRAKNAHGVSHVSSRLYAFMVIQCEGDLGEAEHMYTLYCFTFPVVNTVVPSVPFSLIFALLGCVQHCNTVLNRFFFVHYQSVCYLNRIFCILSLLWLLLHHSQCFFFSRNIG